MEHSTETAHARLKALVAGGYRERAEDPDDPSTVQAMQMVINLPKQETPTRNEVLASAARAVVAVCLDPRAGEEGFWRDRLEQWYSHRIRKVARRARNKAWDDVQALPGVTMGSVRAFVPSAVGEVPHEISKLQIKGTELDETEDLPLLDGTPFIAVDNSLGMSVGKAAAQVGHAAMLLAAAQDTEWVLAWAEQRFALNVREVDPERFREICAQHNAVPVRDAGFTEVAPGSVTVVATP